MAFNTETLGERPDFVGRTGDLDLDGDGIPDLTERRGELFLPSSGFVNDMNNDFITNLGRRRQFIFPVESKSTNQVELLQTARANFRKELNKYNTSFDENIQGNVLKSSAPTQSTLKDFLFTQTGRDFPDFQQSDMQTPDRNAGFRGEGFIETSSGRIISVPKSRAKGI